MVDAWGGWGLFQSLLQTLKRVASKHGVSMSTVAVRYILDQVNISPTPHPHRRRRWLLSPSLSLSPLNRGVDLTDGGGRVNGGREARPGGAHR